MELDHCIANVQVLDGCRLRLDFTDGTFGTVDLCPHIEAGGVFSPMADHKVFSAVRLTRGGRSLEWPCGVDLCADALWMEAHGLESRSA